MAIDNIPTSSKRLLNKLPKLEGAWIAGGAARELFLEKEFENDVDIFFKDKRTSDHWYDTMKRKGYNGKRTAYAVTFTVPDGINSIDVQLVDWNYWDNIKDLFDDFDFTICQIAYDENGFYHSAEAVRALVKNELHFNKIKSGVGGVQRMIKYANKGMVLPDDTIKQFLRQVVKSPNLIDKTWTGQ